MKRFLELLTCSSWRGFRLRQRRRAGGEVAEKKRVSEEGEGAAAESGLQSKLEVNNNESQLPQRQDADSLAPVAPSSPRVEISPGVFVQDGLFSSENIPSSEVHDDMDPVLRAKHERFMREALARVCSSSL